MDQPGPSRTDWRASLERKATTRQPIIPLWLRSGQRMRPGDHRRVHPPADRDRVLRTAYRYER
ncbi:hypothetical protein, partial [Nonomuraea sp. KC401]|uniref:hypothetical protein n=1 Tax=Nonomuraea sp. KC401 TaxID=1848324 RepID=UPI001BB26DE1